MTRAEHSSLEGFLREHLSPQELERPLMVSFTQWDFAVAAIVEIAATLHSMNQLPRIALWSSHTPLRDVGWQSQHTISRLLRSPTIDIRAQKALTSYGLPSNAFVDPYRRWRPEGRLPDLLGTDRSSIRRLTYRGAPMGRGILEIPPSAETPVADEHQWPRRYVHKAMLSYAFAFDQSMRAIDDLNATSVFSYNGRFLHDSAVSHAAEQRELKVLAYDTGGLETDFDLTPDATHDWSALQNRMRFMFDSWPHDEAEAVGAAWFDDRRSHTEKANTKFTGGQSLGKGIDIDDWRRIATFFSSSGDEIAELDLDWADFFGGQEQALRIVADLCRRHDLALIVRTHPHKEFKPKDDVAQWHKAVEAAGPFMHLDEHSDVDSYALMRQSDVVVTFGSTTGIEAAYAGRPVLVLGPSAYDELGCATRPRNIDELNDLIVNPPAVNPKKALPYGLMMKRRGFAFRHVQREMDGGYSLSGVPIHDPVPLVRHLSHALRRGELKRLGAQRN